MIVFLRTLIQELSLSKPCRVIFSRHFVVHLDIVGRVPEYPLKFLHNGFYPVVGGRGGWSDWAAKSEVLTAVLMKIHILQGATPCSYWNFGGTRCLHLQDPRSSRYFLTLKIETGSRSEYRRRRVPQDIFPFHLSLHLFFLSYVGCIKEKKENKTKIWLSRKVYRTWK